MNTIEVNQDQWEKIRPHVVISSYGNKATFFDSIEDINKASKVVTLNGSPLRAVKGRIQTAIEDRIGNTILHLPNGQYAVMSASLGRKVGLSAGLSADIVTSMPEGL